MLEKKHGYIYLSVFYHHDDWHLLLKKLRDLLSGTNQLSGKIQDFWIFLNMHRGSNIRILIECQKPDEKIIIETLLPQLREFTSKYPSAEAKVAQRITSFFADYPNNLVKFNLFDKTVIKHEQLAPLQSCVSRLLLHFFEDHPIDEEGLFTFILYMQHATVSALKPVGVTYKDFYGDILSAMNRSPEFKTNNLIEVDDEGEALELDMFDDAPENIATLLKEYIQLVRDFNDRSLSELSLYFRLMSALKIHLFHIPDRIFFTAASTVSNALLRQVAGTV
jgi:hypothetical protein